MSKPGILMLDANYDELRNIIREKMESKVGYTTDEFKTGSNQVLIYQHNC